MKLKELIFGRTTPTVKVSQYHGSTQEWLPVADIQKGVVITKDGRFVKFVEVLPVNFYLLSPLEQQNLIHYFRSYLKVAPDTLQILVMTQKADIESYVRRMQDFYDSEPVEGCRGLIADNIREVTSLAASEAVTRRFFLVFQYDAKMKAREQSVEAIAQRLWEEEQNARRYLGMCGLEVLSSEYADNFLLETLNGCISKKTSRRQKLSSDVFGTVSKVYGAADDEFFVGGEGMDEAPLPDKSL